MRTRTKQESIVITHDIGGKTGSRRGATTCNREVSLAEVIDDFWGASGFPSQTHTEGVNKVVMRDELTPNYYRRVKSGEILPCNQLLRESAYEFDDKPALYSQAAYTMYRYVDCDSPEGRSSIHFRQGTKREKISSPGPISSVLSSSDIRAAEIEALSRLRTQGMDALTSVWELRKTLAMIAGVRKKLIKLFTDGVTWIRKKGYKNIPTTVRGVLDFLQANWLEGRFGWRILYYDLLAIVNFINTCAEEDRFIVGRSYASASRSGGSSTTMSYTLTDEVRIGYPGILDLSVIGNYGLVNTAWEVLPFSLVVDMFFDVQRWIISLSGVPINVKELQASAFMKRTRKRQSVVQAQFPEPPAGWSIIRHNDASATYVERQQVTRSRIGSPALGLPPFKLNLGGYKPLDLAFMLRILIGKIR